MPIKSLLVLKKAILGLAIGWTVLIAVLCLIRFGNIPSFGVSGVDKYVHATFHFGFTILWGFYSIETLKEIAIPKIGRVVILSLLYGILIEFLQETFTATRHADLFDVLANAIGALIAFLVFVFIKAQKKAN
jgi:VanZ family protein